MAVQAKVMTEQEKKQRIAALRAELKELQATPRSDWHTAFEAFLRFKTYRYKGISIRIEVEIGEDAPRTDYLILTHDEMQDFEEAFFRIFKKINIIEYKNPNDSLNERVIHKIAGYANLLVGTAAHEGDVPVDQVTLSIFRSVKNPDLWEKMTNAGELVETDIPGIYHVVGITKMPDQIVVTSELQGAECAACRALTDKAQEADIEQVIDDATSETVDVVREYYRIFLNLIAEKNPEVFEEIRRDDYMKYPALMKVLEAEVNEKVSNAEQETTVSHIKDIMTKLKYTVEQAMDLLSIPETQRDIYTNLISKKS